MKKKDVPIFHRRYDTVFTWIVHSIQWLYDSELGTNIGASPDCYDLETEKIKLRCEKIIGSKRTVFVKSTKREIWCFVGQTVNNPTRYVFISYGGWLYYRIEDYYQIDLENREYNWKYEYVHAVANLLRRMIGDNEHFEIKYNEWGKEFMVRSDNIAEFYDGFPIDKEQYDYIRGAIHVATDMILDVCNICASYLNFNFPYFNFPYGRDLDTDETRGNDYLEPLPPPSPRKQAKIDKYKLFGEAKRLEREKRRINESLFD
ncbi:MAG: hypothetical protein Hyperionvirus2_118 [Hyperionvirus sp.]|uniref:Uncharacterized protein n=1 Tax=Hyperionvirus sp. TaxID=2487770 RepID=A0A3G5A663_9VIRU|nr:MAG: hypothetical protein Hyperionvirus2_118 [Hyperionvirus sp.]